MTLTFDLLTKSGVRVTCDVGYLCANFGLPRPLCSRLRPDVQDIFLSRRQTVSSLNAPPIRGGGIIINHATIILSSSQLFVLNYHGKRGGGYVSSWRARACLSLCVCVSLCICLKNVLTDLDEFFQVHSLWDKDEVT